MLVDNTNLYTVTLYFTLDFILERVTVVIRFRASHKISLDSFKKDYLAILWGKYGA